MLSLLIMASKVRIFDCNTGVVTEMRAVPLFEELLKAVVMTYSLGPSKEPYSITFSYKDELLSNADAPTALLVAAQPQTVAQ